MAIQETSEIVEKLRASAQKAKQMQDAAKEASAALAGQPVPATTDQPPGQGNTSGNIPPSG